MTTVTVNNSEQKTIDLQKIVERTSTHDVPFQVFRDTLSQELGIQVDKINYVDEDEDKVSLSSQMEFDEFLRSSQLYSHPLYVTGKPLEIKEPKTENPPPAPEVAPQTEEEEPSKTNTEEKEKVEEEQEQEQEKENRLPCIYGNNCYRKSEAHFAEFSHPSEKPLSIDVAPTTPLSPPTPQLPIPTSSSSSSTSEDRLASLEELVRHLLRQLERSVFADSSEKVQLQNLLDAAKAENEHLSRLLLHSNEEINTLQSTISQIQLRLEQMEASSLEQIRLRQTAEDQLQQANLSISELNQRLTLAESRLQENEELLFEQKIQREEQERVNALLKCRQAEEARLAEIKLAEEKREVEERLKREAEEQFKREAEEHLKREAEVRSKHEAEERARRETEERLKREVEERARIQAEEAKKIEELKRIEEEKAKKEQEKKPYPYARELNELLVMGFEKQKCIDALNRNRGNLDICIEELLL